MKRQNGEWVNKAAAKADSHYRKCQKKHVNRDYNSRESRRDFERFIRSPR